METLQELEARRAEIQQGCDRKRDPKDRNRLGQFATPLELALEMLRLARRILPAGERVRFLDPAFGTGSFFSALLRTFGREEIETAAGFEVDPHYGEPARSLWGGTGLELAIADFTQAVPHPRRDRFNLIVCNPPYVRHHHMRSSEKDRLRRLSRIATGTRVGGLAGLYCYFLLLADPWLAAGGVGVWLIPSEFMDVNYGVSLKRYLLSRVTLLRVHRFDARDVQFGDALVSSSVVLFRKSSAPEGHLVEFTRGGSLTHPNNRASVPLSLLDAQTKWNEQPSTEARRSGNGFTLSDFFVIKRGVATGDNRFFIFTRERIQDEHLPSKFFRPILPSPRYLTSEEVPSDGEGNPALDQQLFLLDCRVPEGELRGKYPTLRKYLESGKPRVSGRYLCRSRSPWYSQEERPPAMIVCTYMGRGEARDGRPFRFILNHSRATAANVYLLLYPREEFRRALESKPELARWIWHWLNSIPPQVVSHHGRVYGGGLHKLEPKELGTVPAEEIARLLQLPPRKTGVQLDLLNPDEAPAAP